MKRAGLCVVAMSVFSAVTASAGVEVIVRGAYGSGGSGSPVVYEPAGVMYLNDSDIGTIWKGTASPYGGGFILDGGLGMRVLPFMSIGLTGGIRGASATSPTDNQTDLSRSAYRVGVYARGYVPFAEKVMGNWDPWISAGVGYVHDQQTYTRPVPLGTITMPITYTLTHYGIGIPLGIGIDYHVIPILAFGPSFQYEIVTAAGGCAKTSGANVIGNTFCSSDDAIKRITSAKGYGVWSVGLGARLAF